MKICCLVALFLSFLAGCVSPKLNYQPVENELSIPGLGLVTEAGVGESMLSQGVFVHKDVIFLPENVNAGLFYTLERGYYEMIGLDADSNYYRPCVGIDGGRVKANPFADPWKCIRVTDDNKVSVVTVMNIKVGEAYQDLKREKKLVASENSFQQTLLYSGKINNKINIGYREFFSDRARPAFNNDVEYDLSDSKTIGYKGARIEILEATNLMIRYKVIKNFNTINQ